MTTTTTASQRPRFSYDSARLRAEALGLRVVAVTPADLPAGCSSRDHYGNYTKAETVWLSRSDEAKPALRLCAWATCVSSIHQACTPAASDALHAIAKALQAYDRFNGQEDHYLDHYRPFCRGAHELAQLQRSWQEIKDCAIRAGCCLPVSLIDWLLQVQL